MGVTLLAAALLICAPAAQASRDPGASLDALLAAAEGALRDGELQVAESRYRALLLEAWMLTGDLHVAAGRLEDARAAFRHASESAVDASAAFQALATVHLRLGEADDAVTLLTPLATRSPKDGRLRRLLAQALIAAGAPGEAVQTLEEAHAAAPDDPELAFALATGYLHLKKVDDAGRLLAQVASARPIAETHLLIGRTYRDFGFYDRARASLARALEMNPRTPRAHYYLGTLAVMAEGVLRLDDAIREFQREIEISPGDPLTSLRLGMALVEARRPAEALAPLEVAARAPSAPADAFLYLGRAQLALDRPAAAVASLRQALERSRAAPDDRIRQRNVHYQLALALRASGAAAEAESHFELARQASAQRADSEREQLARYLTDAGPSPDGGTPVALPFESPLSALTPVERAGLERRAADALARAYLNLGVMHAQAERFARAAWFFERAAGVDPAFPQVQYSLGVAYFNAEQYEQAVAPLERALAADPGNAATRRMLAMAALNAEKYEQTVALLAGDAQREADPSLQYAYGLALVRSGRGGDAEAVFERLLTAHGATPELSVVIGQAHAQQGDFDGAIRELQRALQMKPGVAEANAALGSIYLQQGRLREAHDALRAELDAHPGNANAAHTLATVLDLQGRQDEAVAILRTLIGKRPDFANARYLLGKILLARGAADAAVTHLEVAARLAPEDANVHFQLAQAYRKQGRTDLADRHFETYRQLKDRRRSR